ncbi:hypothetical protein [Lysobacter brunescens]|uniref:Uncharacterized protein n=1 Tax=Lysobacter brunescens TaxID=262323 RepID=A0ABW2YDH0_9GAMM
MEDNATRILLQRNIGLRDGGLSIGQSARRWHREMDAGKKEPRQGRGTMTARGKT